MTNLFDLPAELLALILAHLGPLDVVHTSEINKAAYETISQRWVWEEAVRSACRRAQVFESTFMPLSALDLAFLKKTAMRPTLLARKLSRNDGISPASEAVLKCDTALGNFIGVCVVPGGRYIVGTTSSEICIWDLGPSSLLSEMAEVTPRCTFQLKEDDIVTWVVEVFPHGKGSIRFAVQTYTARAGFRIRVYEAGPLTESCDIRPISGFLYLSTPIGALQRHWISGNRTYLHLRDVVAVWDFVDAELALWPITPSSLHVDELFGLDDLIILPQARAAFTRGRFPAWKS